MTCRAPTSGTTCAGTQTGAQMTYDNEGRLTNWQNAPSNPTKTEQMAYDGEGNRVALTVNSGTPTYYISSVEEVSGSAITKSFSAGHGLPTVMRVGSGGSSPLYYLASDGLGSINLAVDGAGNTVSQQLFGPWGTTRYTSGTMPTTYAFTGQRADSASGLDYYGARYYDPIAGQFTSADTMADGLNRFGYVHGNPETYNDPSGHMVGCGPDDCGGGGDAGDPNQICSIEGCGTYTPPPVGCQATHDCINEPSSGGGGGDGNDVPTYFNLTDFLGVCLKVDHPDYCTRFYAYDAAGHFRGPHVPDSLSGASTKFILRREREQCPVVCGGGDGVGGPRRRDDDARSSSWSRPQPPRRSAPTSRSACL
jgi:RHS repeat-associated protein